MRVFMSASALLFVSALLSASTAGAASRIDNAALLDSTDGTNWAAHGRTFSEQRFSPLDQINRQTVNRLGLAWTLELPDQWSVSSAPVAVDGVIYFAAGLSVVYAVDAVSGKLLWKYDPKMTGRKVRMAWGIRGLTYYGGRVFVGVQDGRLLAIDAATGKLAWEVQTTEADDNRYITGAPRVFNGKVIIGHGGADFGKVRGYVTTYDAATGKQLWRWYTVPGDPKLGFENKAMEMAAKTWTGEWWNFGGGGTVWNAITYDPEFNRVYLGTGNGSPWNAKIRSPGGGDNLFLCAVVALDADTGEYVWHYQTNPGESWDYNSAMDMVLADLTIDGKVRKVLLHAPKNGFYYVIDRATGKLISAEKIGKVNWADHVDLATGRPVENRGARYEDGRALVWPSPGGVHNWQEMAHSPDTGLSYIPAHEMPAIFDDTGINPRGWKFTRFDVLGLLPYFKDIPKEAGTSSLLAWNPATQKKAWELPTPGFANGGVITTHGGLVFQGQSDGKFIAHDANTGAALWTFDMGVGTQAPPITFSAGGHQYVSILAGWGGSQMYMGSLGAQHGWIGRDHPRRLLTFALDAKAPLPPSPPPSSTVTAVDDPKFVIDPAKVGLGQNLYFVNCVICHGMAAVAGGYAPDLRASPVPLSAEGFEAVVRQGALEPREMPKFPELTDAELDALRHYIRSRARAPAPSTWDQLADAWDFVKLSVKMELLKRGWL